MSYSVQESFFFIKERKKKHCNQKALHLHSLLQFAWTTDAESPSKLKKQISLAPSLNFYSVDHILKSCS